MHVECVKQVVITRGASNVRRSRPCLQNLNDVVLQIFILEVDERLEPTLLCQDDEELTQTVASASRVRVRDKGVVGILGRGRKGNNEIMTNGVQS